MYSLIVPDIRKIAGYIFILAFFASSCTNNPFGNKHKKIEADKSITQKTSFNNLFIDSNSIGSFLSKNPEYESFKQQYSDFYKLRNYQCAWFDSSGLIEQAYNFMNLVSNAVNIYNDSSLYNKQLTQEVDTFKKGRSEKGFSTPDIMETELKLTGQFFKYASKVYKGADINIEELGWFIPRKKLDITALLDSLIDNKPGTENTELPLSEAYRNLLDYLPVYRKIEQSIKWDPIEYSGKSLHIGADLPLISTIKQRLFALGDLALNDSSNLFDTSLVMAVKNFQTRMGLSVDGVIGQSFIRQINITPAKRIEQIMVNLERQRWMPPVVKDSTSIVVNIPEYKLYVYKDGKLQFDMNVVVGAAATSTVIFTGDLKYIVFSPYWNVPSSIVKKEILPGIARNSNYLPNHNMEIYKKSESGFPSIRQLPGPGNSLGRVKFLFPNNYDIYLHDTNNHNAFNSSKRSISHGCIRLSQPKKLAMYLLSYDTVTYSSHNIDSLMNLSKEKWVTLKTPVPVTISYYTAFVDANGKLNFRNDIYKHDSAMAAKLFTTNNNLALKSKQ